jgi:hypothetical protein
VNLPVLELREEFGQKRLEEMVEIDSSFSQTRSPEVGILGCRKSNANGLARGVSNRRKARRGGLCILYKQDIRKVSPTKFIASRPLAIVVDSTRADQLMEGAE